MHIKLHDGEDVKIVLSDGLYLTVSSNGLIIPNPLNSPVVRVSLDEHRIVQIDGEMATVSLLGTERAPAVTVFEGPNADEPDYEWFLGDK